MASAGQPGSDAPQVTTGPRGSESLLAPRASPAPRPYRPDPQRPEELDGCQLVEELERGIEYEGLADSEALMSTQSHPKFRELSSTLMNWRPLRRCSWQSQRAQLAMALRLSVQVLASHLEGLLRSLCRCEELSLKRWLRILLISNCPRDCVFAT